MTADEPIEIGFLNQEIAKSQEAEPAPAEEEDAFAWLAAAFADEDDEDAGAPQDESSAEPAEAALPARSDLSDGAVEPPIEDEHLEPARDGGKLREPPVERELAGLADLPTEESIENELPRPPTLSLVPPHVDEPPEINLAELAQKIAPEESSDLQAAETPDAGALAANQNRASSSIDALRKRQGFREELLAAFHQIYGR